MDVYLYPTDVGRADYAEKVFSFVRKQMYCPVGSKVFEKLCIAVFVLIICRLL